MVKVSHGGTPQPRRYLRFPLSGLSGLRALRTSYPGRCQALPWAGMFLPFGLKKGAYIQNEVGSGTSPFFAFFVAFVVDLLRPESL